MSDTISNWFHSAPWYYLLAIAAGGVIFVALIITIIVVAVKRKNKNNAQPPIVTRELQNIVTVPTVIPSTYPTTTDNLVFLPSQSMNVLVDSQGQAVKIPLPAAAFLEPLARRKDSFIDIPLNDSPVSLMKKGARAAPPAHPHPSNLSTSLASSTKNNVSSLPPRASWISLDGSAAHKLQAPTTVETAAENFRASMKPLPITMKKKIQNDVLRAEAEEIERQLNEEVSDGEDDINVEESDNESECESEEEEISKKPIAPVVFGPYSSKHNSAAIIIQHQYRDYMKKVEAEVTTMMNEMSFLSSSLNAPPKLNTAA